MKGFNFYNQRISVKFFCHKMQSALFILFFSFSITAISQTGFQKLFSEPIEYQEFSYSRSDSSFIMAGCRYSTGVGYDFCAVKLDRNGNELWSKTFSSPGDDYLTAVSVSSAGDILMSGYRSDSLNDNNYFLLKLNSNGIIQWSKSYGTSSMEASVYSGENEAGDIFISGNREMTERPGIIKTNSSGAVIWSKSYGSSAGFEQMAMASMSKDGGIALMGLVPSQKIFFMKVAPDGNTSWNYAYNPQYTQFLSSLRNTQDGGYVIASSDYRCDATGCHAYFTFLKLDSVGNVSWAKAVEGFLGRGRDGIETSDGGFVFTGQIQDSSGGYTVALLKTDSNGNLAWMRSYSNYGWSGEGYYVEETVEGGFVIFGIAGSTAYLIKTDANGISGCNEKLLNPVLSNMTFSKSSSVTFPELPGTDVTFLPTCTEINLPITDSIICTSVGIQEWSAEIKCRVFPNPFSGAAVLSVDLPALKGAGSDLQFTLYDTFGRIVRNSIIENSQMILIRGDLVGGIYFYTVQNGHKIICTGKIIAE